MLPITSSITGRSRGSTPWASSRRERRSIIAGRTIAPGLRARAPSSVRLGTGEFDHLPPFFGFVGNELSEVGGRAGKQRGAEIGEPHLRLGIGEDRIDLLVELVDDVVRCPLRHADAVPSARLVTR